MLVFVAHHCKSLFLLHTTVQLYFCRIPRWGYISVTYYRTFVFLLHTAVNMYFCCTMHITVILLVVEKHLQNACTVPLTVEDSLQNPFFVPLCRRQHYVQDSLQNLNVLLLFSRSGHLPPKLPSNFGNPWKYIVYISSWWQFFISVITVLRWNTN